MIALSSTFPLLMTPGPTNIHPRVLQSMMRPVIDHRSPEFRSLYQRIQEGLKYAYQTNSDVYTLTGSGTAGLECTIRSLISPGDKVAVVVCGVFSQRLATNFKHHGAHLVEVKSEAGKAPKPEELEAALKSEKGVKVVAIVYNETSTGVTLRELPRIVSTAKNHGALAFVDAISILGGDTLPVDKWGIDICVTGSQKCMAVPPGLAFISVNNEAWSAIEKKEIQSEYFNLKHLREYHKRSETPFTPAVSLFFALEEALAMIREEGMDNRIARHAKCAKAFYAAIESMGLEVFPNPQYRSNTVIAVRSPQGIEEGKMREVLRNKYGVSLAGGMGEFKGKMFRIGCMGLISQREVLLTLCALASALNDVGMQLNYERPLATALSALS